MKIGLILECIAGGADELVCRHLIGLLQPTTQIAVAPLGNKPKLISQCGDSAAILLAQGCDRVIILWDLHPPWQDRQPCRKQDREAIFAALQEKVDQPERVFLVCIERELETWLIADRSLLQNAFPRLPAKDFQSIRRLEETDPKTILSTYFRRTTGNPYVGSEKQVRQLLQHLTDCKRIHRKCETFRRFVAKLTV